MVSIKFGADIAIDMRAYDYDIGSLPYVESVSYSSTYLRGWFSDGTYVSIEGSGFSYNQSTGIPNGGEIRSIYESNGGEVLVSVTGLRLAVTSLVKVAQTYTVSDDIALVKSALGGNDSITGGITPMLFSAMAEVTFSAAGLAMTSCTAATATTCFTPGKATIF
ncbi:hypothetical protein [Pararhizobium sp. LjRoot238]|uniref:hypothetical protein n=1 Tax=Pararhizobium sp. LjRoot238 TaxID=3342293 RepID=UPI003ED08D08